MSSAMRARASRPSRGASRRLSRSRSSEAKSRSRLRHCSDFTGSKVCVSSRSIRSAENGSTDAGDAEGAVVHVAAGAAGDLAELAGGQLAMHLAVELARAGEGDVIDIEVEAHADGVGGDQEIDVAGLIERHLGVARARAERAQHDRRAAALAADQLGDGVDLGRREGDQRRARRQPRDLLLAGVGELGEARPRDEVGAGNEIADGLAHGLRAEQQRLLLAAHVQQAVGEDVAALGVGGELHLVDGEEIDVGDARHGLDRAHPVARPLRLDLLLAGDERDVVGAGAGGDLVVDLAREQAQRQADEPACRAPACARSPDASCRCWWARARP